MTEVYRQGKKLIKSIDAFGQPIMFNIDGKESYKSFVGGVTTIFMLVAITFVFQQQIVNFFDKIKLQVSVQQEFSTVPGVVQLNYKNFLFALAVEQPTGYIYNSQPFYLIEAEQVFKNNTSGINEVKKVPLERCSLEQFKKFSESTPQYLDAIYTQYSFQNYLCPNSRYNMTLNGSYLSDEFSYVRIKVIPCTEENKPDWADSCAPENIVQQYIQDEGSLRLSFYTSNYVVNAQKPQDFSQLFISEDLNFQFQPQSTSTSVNVYFRTYKVDTDQSLFVNQQVQSQVFVFREQNSITSQTILSPKSTKSQTAPIVINLRSDNFSYYAKRRFQKVDELLSYFGGIFQLFLLVLGILMKIYNKKYFRLSLANKLYDFTEFKHHKSKRRDQLEHIVHQEHHHHHHHHDNSDSNNGEMPTSHKPHLSDVADFNKIKELGFESRNEFLIWYFEEVFMTRRKLRESITYIFYFLTCKKKCATTTNKLMDKAIEKIEKDMNVRHLINNVIKIDKLKKLVLTKSQAILFDFEPKPEINLIDTHKIKVKARLHSKIGNPGEILKKVQGQKMTSLDFKSFQKLMEAFHELNRMDTSDETTKQVNQKLMQLLGPEIRAIFKVAFAIQEQDDKLENHNAITPQDRKKTHERTIIDQLKIEDNEVEEIQKRLQQNQQRNALSPDVIEFEEY